VIWHPTRCKYCYK